MTSQPGFNEIGFLATECQTGDYSQQLHDTAAYQVCEQLNQLGQYWVNHSQTHSDDQNEVYLTLYFQRLVAHFQGLLLLSERGMTHQAAVLSRCVLEAFINLAAYHRHPDLLEAMVAKDDDKRRTVLNAFYQAQQQKTTLTTEELRQVAQNLDSADPIVREDVSLVVKADFAGLMQEYRTVYALLTESVSSCLHSLHADLIVDEMTNQIVGIETRATDTDEMISLLMSAAENVADAISIMMLIHPIETKQPELQQLKRQLQQVWSHTSLKVAHR